MIVKWLFQQWIRICINIWRRIIAIRCFFLYFNEILAYQIWFWFLVDLCHSVWHLYWIKQKYLWLVVQRNRKLDKRFFEKRRTCWKRKRNKKRKRLKLFNGQRWSKEIYVFWIFESTYLYEIIRVMCICSLFV